MFFTFLNKDDPCCLDISVLIKYPPEEILFYYYNSPLRIPWHNYSKIKELAEGSHKPESPAQKWLQLFDQTLGIAEDLKNLNENEYITSVGPYYYTPTNTRFYFLKNSPTGAELVNSTDLENIVAFNCSASLNKEINTYYKSKKTKRKTARTKDELIKDMNMCLLSLQEIEKLNKQINYLNKLLEHRYLMVEGEDIAPAEPDNLPAKPEKPEEIEVSSGNILSRLKARQKKQNSIDCSQYTHDTKVYFIRYREYEKACDRYKEVLENWPADHEKFVNNCLTDIEKAEQQLKISLENLKIYNHIIQKSFIHSDYQNIKILELFKYYLNTGRADELQDCMNLFEEERHWTDIKASQERIENTIYYLQNANPETRFADEHINQLLTRFNPKSSVLAKV